MKFRFAAAARFSTSKVAPIAVAIPVTIVSGLPALIVSTVCSRHGTAAAFLILSMTSWAVNPLCCAVTVLTASQPHAPARACRLVGWIGIGPGYTLLIVRATFEV